MKTKNEETSMEPSPQKPTTTSVNANPSEPKLIDFITLLSETKKDGPIDFISFFTPERTTKATKELINFEYALKKD